MDIDNEVFKVKENMGIDPWRRPEIKAADKFNPAFFATVQAADNSYDADLQYVIDALEKLHVRADEAYRQALEAQEFHKESTARIHKMHIEAALGSAKRAQDFLNQ